ncbi:ornithine cyclodeaminase family protein [Cupriavidus lacunae]|uniref:Ornithine cyclodeaminase family protein n=1 Tax=Cupriavidus lacunae TaxID=2666307 RepID=A0A370NRE2_9BURK|nr:ornithine cyclodeaminase family protein [Cupriavidus lacunae]RDK08154.1 ornithine cyclodeaminase family protein [Cupriavidus lacunae]
MTNSAMWLTEQDVAAHVSLKDAIYALEAGLLDLASGSGFNVPKALGSFGDGSSMHSLGSALPVAGYCGFKNWIHTKRGAKAVFVLFDATEGRMLAMMEANVLGQLRTSAITGLGTKWMANLAAGDLAIIGTGRQALMQVAAINAVRPLTRIRVWSPTPEKRLAFAGQVRSQYAAEVNVASTLDSAVDGADIVTLVTRAQTPFLSGKLLSRGAHLNAVGAILPGNAEFHQDVFERAGFIAVDNLANVQKASREFSDYFGVDATNGSWERVVPLERIVAGDSLRPDDCDISLFKAVGMGISDLSVARLAYERAVADSGNSSRMPLSVTATLR